MRKYCHNCSQMLMDYEAFCTKCGQRYEAAPTDAITQQTGHYENTVHLPNAYQQHQQPNYSNQTYGPPRQGVSQSWWTTEKIIILISAIVVFLAGTAAAVYFLVFNNQNGVADEPLPEIEIEEYENSGNGWGLRPPNPPPAPPIDVDVTSVIIVYANQEIPDEFTMRLGEPPIPLNTRVEPIGNRAQINWSSSDSSVVEVMPSNPQGTSADIRANGIGNAWLTVEVGGVIDTCLIRVTEQGGDEPSPPPPPAIMTSLTVYETILNTSDWVRLTADWPDWTGGNRPTVFERDKGSLVWIMRGRSGETRVVDPIFSHRGDALIIGFPTTTSQYFIYDDKTGVFGSSNERLTWQFETDPNHRSFWEWETQLTSNLQGAISYYQVVALRVYWSNNQYEIFYREDNGRWRLRGRNGSFNIVEPSFNYQPDGSVILSLPNTSSRYTFNEGGHGSYGGNSFTWSFCGTMLESFGD